jgi:pimeloyl-ACP methyl ester carboxylesterase
MASIRTSVLEIVYKEGGPQDGPPVMLLHGWPDAPCGWSSVAERLGAAGWRTITPYLRGSQPTRFLSPTTPRFGAGVALAQDAIDLADALGLQRFAVVGHDWGARAAYTMAALYPERLSAIACLALAYQPRGVFKVPGLEQSRRFWYQWFQCIDGGVEVIQRDPVAFARLQWETWSPSGWFNEEDFAAAAESFRHPDWMEITLNAYRSRWLPNQTRDAAYDLLEQRLSETERIAVPTVMIQGAADQCDAPAESEGLEAYFTGGYRRLLLGGIGHFPHREAPEPVAGAVVRLLQETS